ncbi:MAG: hypothetical protein LLG14_19120 [Nocardiaceae bacterium]|nr:hypothetical protein [Nocardiaceae bacterium]
MGFTSQLSFLDAINNLGARSNLNVDWFGYFAFGGPATSPTEVVAHLAERFDAIRLLRRRLVELPGQLDTPYWVRDDRELSSYVEVRELENGTYAEYERDNEKILGSRIDAREQPFKLYVYCNVSGVPNVGDGATIIVIHACHAMLVGASVPPLLDALFGAEAVEFAAPGVEVPLDKPMPTAAGLLRVSALPGRICVWLLVLLAVAVRRRFKREKSEGIGHRPVMGPSGLSKVDPRNPAAAKRSFVIVSVPSEELSGSGLSITAACTTAISYALQDYHEQMTGERPANLTMMVAVALPDADFLGVNRLGGAPISMHGEIDDIGERGAAISAEIKRARQRVAVGEIMERRWVQQFVPYPFIRLSVRHAMRKAPPAQIPDPRLFTSVSSVNVGTGVYAVAGRPLRSVWGYQGGAMDLVHTVVGHGPELRVTAVATEAVADIGLYERLLSDALMRVRDALQAARVPR